MSYRLSVYSAISLMFAGLVLASLAFNGRAIAEEESTDTSAQRLKLVTTHCSAALVDIKRVKFSDLASRTNRGRAYETLTQLITAFNSRSAQNNLAYPRMTAINIEARSLVKSFDEKFVAYSDALDKVLAIDCKQKPADFYRLLVEARNQRAKLSDDVMSLQLLISEYRTFPDIIKQQLNTGSVLRSGDRQ